LQAELHAQERIGKTQGVTATADPPVEVSLSNEEDLDGRGIFIATIRNVGTEVLYNWTVEIVAPRRLVLAESNSSQGAYKERHSNDKISVFNNTLAHAKEHPIRPDGTHQLKIRYQITEDHVGLLDEMVIARAYVTEKIRDEQKWPMRELTSFFMGTRLAMRKEAELHHEQILHARDARDLDAFKQFVALCSLPLVDGSYNEAQRRASELYAHLGGGARGQYFATLAFQRYLMGEQHSVIEPMLAKLVADAPAQMSDPNWEPPTSGTVHGWLSSKSKQMAERGRVPWMWLVPHHVPQPDPRVPWAAPMHSRHDARLARTGASCDEDHGQPACFESKEKMTMHDGQSGEPRTHGGNVTTLMASMGYHCGNGSSRPVIADSGGASRFYPQFREDTELHG
jgi:hypothetical protein